MDSHPRNHKRASRPRLSPAALALAAALFALPAAPQEPGEPRKIALYLPFPEDSLRGAAHVRALDRISGEKVHNADFHYNWGVPADQIGSRLARLAFEEYAGVFLLSPKYYRPADAAMRKLKDPPYVTVLAEVGRPGLPNAYSIRTYEGFYLAGMVAGFASRSGAVGMVSTAPTSETVRNINAFALGMRTRNPEAKVYVFFIGRQSDPDLERAVANGLVHAQGVDLLAHDTDSDTVPRVADESGVWSIPFRIGEDVPLGAKTLVRVRTDWEGLYRIQLNRILNGGSRPVFAWHGLREKALALGDFHHLLPTGVIDEVKGAERRIRAGDAHPFEGPIRRANGTPVAGEGQRLGDRELVRMDYFVEGVVRLRDRRAGG